MALTIYQYPNCSTCKKALAWLKANAIAATSIDIVVSPPSRTVLERAQKLAGVPVKKMFNLAGASYRDGDFKTKLPAMTDAQAFAALAKDGKLIKRPLVLGDDVALVGFDEAAWREALS
ncbi:MAG TPA: Spx/MgsR family RNA polymerase-binding regulatory protein [Kofleriaceae bacterium]|jgi:arsenate reductase|nr:Spx/MgsR family RNA polymerase-binding regulatory protein [Kofleriaceae bacterium]